MQDVFSLRELCSGIGGLSIGAAKAVFATTCLVEQQSSICAVAESLHTVPVLKADINKVGTVALLLQQSTKAASIGCGFSCQPFSQAGDSLGGTDQRSSTLPSALWIAYMIGAQLIVLECVGEAPAYVCVIAAFETAGCGRMTQLKLHNNALTKNDC